MDSFEREDNESFLYENDYLFDICENNTNSFEMGSSNGMMSDLLRSDLTLDDNEFSKIRKNILSIKLSKSQNKSDLNIFYSKKPLFAVSGNKDKMNQTTIFSQTNSATPSSTNKLNLSAIDENFSTSSKRGRKKFLFDGVKTEIIDKAFLREFKHYLKKNRHHIKVIYDELKQDEKIFWNEFLLCNNPPFNFTQNRSKIEYKSFSKTLLRFVFSHQSVRQLYAIFIREKGKELVNSIINKKIKKIDRKMLLFYSFYGNNIHKFYSNDYSINDINVEELEGFCLNCSSNANTMSSSSDSLNFGII